MVIHRYTGILWGIGCILALPFVSLVWNNGLDKPLLSEAGSVMLKDSSSESNNNNISSSVQLRNDAAALFAREQEELSALELQEAEMDRIRKQLETASTTWDLLPRWAQDYFVWHNWIRQQFPDTALTTDPAAPKIFVQVCRGGACGGTFDRLGRVENLLAFASLTKRVLLFKWFHPYPLEEFLAPTLLCNWTAPATPQFEANYIDQQPDVKSVVPKRPWNGKSGFIHTFLEQHGKDEEKILYSFKSLPGTASVPHKQLQLHQPQVTGAIFRSLFQPSVAVQAQLDRIYGELNISPGNYSAAHCRVRHPGFFGYKAAGKQNGTDADASGLIFADQFKQKATQAALMGLQCTTRLLNNPKEPIYFLSDSEDLVEYVVHGKGRTGPNQTQVDKLVTNVTQTVRVVSRNTTGVPTLHINRQVGFPVEYYLPTFVDLYIAAQARCVSFGVGNFGMLATKISGTTCRQEHNFMASRTWARKFQQDRGGASQCHLPPVVGA